MEKLTFKERELVALGAAIGSNCVPCVEYHIPTAKKAGLSDDQINEAVKIAEMVKKVPADKVLATALELVKTTEEEVCQDPGCECRQVVQPEQKIKCCE